MLHSVILTTVSVTTGFRTHNAIADEGILTSLLGNERQDLFRGRKEGSFDILITRHLMDNETKFREYFHVARDFFQTILSAIKEHIQDFTDSTQHINRIAGAQKSTRGQARRHNDACGFTNHEQTVPICQLLHDRGITHHISPIQDPWFLKPNAFKAPN
jgi:hypothetical protein